MRTPAVNSSLQRALSMPRLGRYLNDSAGILDAALSLYERNARIAEAFNLPLQGVEICLRNHINERFVAHYGPNWYRTDAAPFTPGAIEKLDKAMKDLERNRVPLTQGAVVAELSFGFWVAALGRPYSRSMWPPVTSAAFFENGRRMAWQRVHNRMNELRDFRNRVAHHEPIYHLQPSKIHDDLLEAVGWMCRDTSAWIAAHSRVPHVLAHP